MREEDILAKGTITTAEHVIGVAGGLFFGFGIGHAVQGRYGERGFLFMLGEFAAAAVALGGLVSCITGDCNDTYIIVGVGGFGVLRVWEIIDLIVVPPGYNERYWRVRSKVYGTPAPRWGAVVVPTSGGGGVASFSLRF